MDKQLQTLQHNLEAVVQRADAEGIEFWFARDLQTHLGYARWENFQTAISRSIKSCEATGHKASDHFRGVTKMVDLGSGSKRKIDDFMLTRYACYLIAQNGDPRKPEIAFAQSYFALQTRKQELIEERMRLQARMEARDRLKESEKNLSQNIFERGVDNAGFGRIRSQGDKALFGGNTTQGMKDKYGIVKNRPLADFLPTLTIAAKNLATEITNHNVEQDNLQGERAITKEHVQNNESLRDKLDDKKYLLLFAYNGTGKTRLSMGFKKFSACIKQDTNDPEGIVHARMVNVLSHGNYSLFEPMEMLPENKQYFKKILTGFMSNYQFNPELFQESLEQNLEEATQ